MFRFFATGYIYSGEVKIRKVIFAVLELCRSYTWF